jgi:hypothetical protein
MRFVILIFGLVLLANAARAQSETGASYILTIDGVEQTLTLDQEIKVTLKSGQQVPVKLTRPEFGRFVVGSVSFEYPGQYTVSSARIDVGINQHMVATALGTMLLIQEYDAGLPGGLTELMYDEMVKEPKALGIDVERSDITRKTADGTELNGVRAYYKATDEDVTIDIITTERNGLGYLIITMNDVVTSPDEKPMVERFWQSVTLK